MVPEAVGDAVGVGAAGVALAADDVRSDVPAGVRLGIDDPYAQVKATLLAEVAEANRCRAVWSKGFGFATVRQG